MGAPYFQSRPDIIVIQLDKILQAIGIAVEFRRSDIVVKEKRNAGDANSSIPCEASSLARRRVLINIFSYATEVLCRYTCQYIRRRAVRKFSME